MAHPRTQRVTARYLPLQLLLVLLLLLLPASFAASASAAADVDAPLAAAVGGVGMTVSDLDRSVDFYTGVLTFDLLDEHEVAGDAVEHWLGVFGVRARTATLRLGDELIQLTEFLAPRGRAIPADSRSNDGWFQHVAIITSDMESAYRHLRRHDVEHISPGPQRLPDWNPNAGGIEAFYFRDPDGHALEILQFPPGKGLPKWHPAGEAKLFLGIDHTAIAIRDTEESLSFYRDLLGFRIAGESENYGPEQERLNQVFGARLRITALRVAAGPGVELLEYLTPRGRPMPIDERANDLFHWQTTVVAPGLETSASGVAERLRAAAVPFVSSGVGELGTSTLPFERSLLVRDPDGHVVELRNR